MKNCWRQAESTENYTKPSFKPNSKMNTGRGIFAELKHIHFVGIGGAGTAPLAGIMLQKGCKISGSDLISNKQTEQLRQEGAQISEGHAAANLPPETQLLVYSSAAAGNNPELLKADELHIPRMRRGEFLAKLVSRYPRAVAVCGSHGKTTITAMLVWIMRECGIPCSYLIGGKANAFPAYGTADSAIFISEADESDGTNALFAPFIGVVSNIEDDHSWSVGGTEALLANFARFGRQSENLIYRPDGKSAELFLNHPGACRLSDDSFAEYGDIEFNGFMKTDAVFACSAAEKLGIPRQAAMRAVNKFPGVARRMTVHFASPTLTLIEDYAHHPTEVASSLELLRRNYPHYHLRVVFQPHRYARLAKYLDAFARELARADSVFTVPVFAAWTEKGRVNSRMLAERTGAKAVNLDLNWTEMPAIILKNRPEKLLIAVLGAGDVEKLIPELKGRLTHAGK
ncbi:MAG: Mur ligase domain-containing protein [Victivallaceae bacterium]|nr:Mur ligase domain-containing protein [Victivallaceae bacterium]